MLTSKGSGKNISGFLPTDPELLRKAKERSSLKREIKKINIYEYIEEEWFSLDAFINSLEHVLMIVTIIPIFYGICFRKFVIKTL